MLSHCEIEYPEMKKELKAHEDVKDVRVSKQTQMIWILTYKWQF